MDGDGDMDWLTGPAHGFSADDTHGRGIVDENDGNADGTWTAADIDMDEDLTAVGRISLHRYGWRLTDMDIVEGDGDDDT